MTTGNTLTVSLVIDGVLKASEIMGIDLTKAKVTIIGGTGDIGSAVAKIFSETVAEVTITSRSEKNLIEIERILTYYGKAKITTSRENNEAIKGADIVIAAASVSNSIINLNNFKSGAVICDVGYPKNISYTSCDRKDILIFSGGICSIPSEFNLGFDIGMPTPYVLYGCFAEAILLALEDRYENYSWGKGNITRDRIGYIRAVASKHGFILAPFFWGNRLLKDSDIEQIRDNASKALLKNAR
jgi:predicted amino acid dehydrogenase